MGGDGCVLASGGRRLSESLAYHCDCVFVFSCDFVSVLTCTFFLFISLVQSLRFHLDGRFVPRVSRLRRHGSQGGAILRRLDTYSADSRVWAGLLGLPGPVRSIAVPIHDNEVPVLVVRGFRRLLSRGVGAGGGAADRTVSMFAVG